MPVADREHKPCKLFIHTIMPLPWLSSRTSETCIHCVFCASRHLRIQIRSMSAYTATSLFSNPVTTIYM
ncbi:hypothetical protein HBI56_050360 [Parastagonospora nodorum]|nr:hypothetical protein HBH51_131510 [Parastagonospora nodorum]KAH4091081.1 hypothetical protein HBH46_187440 [Parastagonospora nodorum]KAH4111971.1 hypothetical protein HBH47_232810 [Parastagonospora nodorum]KAH4178827.1 hypothetical protein HBH43_029110 [Parastagonospora nodorum]KAH4193966.1 hypothetical protein HBH42_090830 [Parastagonospora nodorum]